MDYTPRYPQPFTFAEARLLDVQTITEEIARLQNSLQRLHETQTLLREAIASEADPELTKALEENQTVIVSGSQTERISILRLALADKGISMGAHYDIAAEPTREVAQPVAGTPQLEEGGGDGVDL
ncbi:hypothetical protein C8F01DRAFT_1050487 [Mycena amicta]|nr:hypothetical protein C8F01DRAFT_1050487 [Mycena amicta]